MNHLTLGDFLHRRRAALTPTNAEPRRVRGLRREEVADLAGVSVDYYSKLEQGKRRLIPSNVVLRALADVLELDGAAREHMYDLARLGPHPVSRRASAIQTVRPSTFQLMETLADVPVVLLGRRTDVLAANPLARLVIADFPAMPSRERNAVRWLSLSGRADLHQDWFVAACHLIGMLRMDLGRYPDDPETIKLIEELTARSRIFRTIWAKGPVSSGGNFRSTLFYGGAARIDVQVKAVRITDDPDQTLHVMIPGADPATQAAMAEIRRGIATRSPRSAPGQLPAHRS
ncbi:helix-turn-helix domain-containing protein [Actinoplanes sp. TBRC 11911]|uniref:helix-turn-helix domain-containing protein n=1 Tax=Actinoplanes sp. TBRC 11911 TaxID=2729386 RepID=UPI00145D0137|nr:helix-turn-helix transcriptional regulator [Actinoplanes sp. TBRC 11911]NMO54636.1 helix-turn-helix domain-containing protein [Actinoplanes sp. TBRC 11911]